MRRDQLEHTIRTAARPSSSPRSLWAARRPSWATHDESHLRPRMVGHASLALAPDRYEVWLEDDDASLLEVLADSMSCLKDHLAD
jgi:MftR C-terminal domain